MVIYIRGKNGGLSNALEGLERGLGNGLQIGMQQRRLDQQDAQYQDAKARAERELAIEEAQNARAQQDQDYQTKQRAEIDAGQKEISQYALDYQGKDEAVGQGLGAFADLQQAQNAKAERASRIVKKLPAVLQDRFRSEFRAEMEDEQNIALMEHLKTRLTNAGASPLRSEGGELGHKGEERAAQLQSWQEAVDLATTPEARAQLVPQIANGLRALQIDDAIELKRLRTVARVADTAKQAIAQKAQLIDQARAIGEPPEVIADMEASLEAMETTAAMYEASGGEMTATQLNSAMQVARGARAPRSGARTGTGTGSQDGGADDSKARQLDFQIRDKAADLAQKELDRLITAKTDPHDVPPYESLFAKHYKMLGGRGDQERQDVRASLDPMEPFKNQAPGAAIENTVMNGDDWKSKVQELVDSGRGREARELFMKARGEQFNHTSKPGNEADKLPTDGKKLLRARR